MMPIQSDITSDMDETGRYDCFVQVIMLFYTVFHLSARISNFPTFVNALMHG